MTSDRAWYWVAAGVLALGLGNSFANRQMGCIQELTDQVHVVENDLVAQASDQVVRILDVATRFSGQEELRAPQMQVALSRIQSRVACLQTLAAEKQAEMARHEAEKAREEMIENRAVEEICPRQELQEVPVIKVRQMPDDDTI
ncbi:MAG TPA: hypothetical protein VLW84_06700 [Terriglobales bacterium]|nr:hypothetical protein [Terriglobales bacterium]